MLHTRPARQLAMHLPSRSRTLSPAASSVAVTGHVLAAGPVGVAAGRALLRATALSLSLRRHEPLADGLPHVMHVSPVVPRTLVAPSLGVEMTTRKLSWGSMVSVCPAQWLLVPTSVLLRKSAAQAGCVARLLLSRQTRVVLQMNEASLRRVLLDPLLAESTCLLGVPLRRMTVQNESCMCGLRPCVLHVPTLPALRTPLSLPRSSPMNAL